MSEESLEILNAAFQFVREASPQIRSKFDGIPQKTLLSEGETLFRFLEPEFSDSGYNFWLPLETYHHLRLAAEVPAWAVWRNSNSRSQTGPATFCRATLRRRVYGFKGLAGAAGRKTITTGSLISSGYVWIPSLTRQDFFLRTYSLSLPPAALL